MENWRSVVGYEDYFMISDKGRLYSKRSDRILKQSISKNGYYTVATRIGGRKGLAVCFKIHRLVAEAFLNYTEDKPQVNHKDGNKLNNLLENLEWVSQSENALHAHATGLSVNAKKEENKNSKLTEEIVRQIRKEYKPSQVTQRFLAQKYGVSKTTIQSIVTDKVWN